MSTSYEGNVLAITDEEVASNWQLGMLRALGKVIAGEALPADSTERWGQPTPGSNRAHVAYMGFGRTEVPCTFTEIYDVKEDTAEEWYHNSFNEMGGTAHERTELRALGSCACGRLVRHPISMMVPIGEMIYKINNADED